MTPFRTSTSGASVREYLSSRLCVRALPRAIPIRFRVGEHVPQRLGKTLASLLLVLSACGCSHRAPTLVASKGGWHDFEGTWTAAGSRYIMQLGSNRQASIANLAGSLLLNGPSRPALGFRAEAIVLNDTAAGMVGRAVWTDEHGDQAYSELRGEGTATSNKVVGTFLGGTGRYSGATGTYEFSWRFLLQAEDGSVQGQSIGLKGRVRFGSESTQSSGEGRHS